MIQAMTNALRLLLAITTVAVAAMGPPARATIQEESCVEPDIEYPVPCED
jgi:hypothetical protein